jgi:PEP-CTERM motif-containing protein
MKKLILALCVPLALIGAGQAFADTNLHVVGSFSDPVQISSNSIEITDVANNSNIYGPLQVIIGIPNVASFSDPITSPANIGVVNTALFTSAFKGDVYSLLGLAGPTNNSNLFTNWAGADSTINGITVTEFDVLQYSLLTNITGGDTVTIDFLNNLPIGSYLVSYASFISGNGSGNPENTAFTNAGLVVTTPHQVPEPSTLLMLGSGFLGLAAYRRFRVKK